MRLSGIPTERSSAFPHEDMPCPGDGGGKDAVCAALARVLREGVDIHRCLAAQALGRIDSASGVPALLEALLDEDEDVRTDAAGALARLVPAEAETPLLENLLGDPCAGVKLNAIDGLVRLRSAGLTPWLVPLAKGRDERIAWDETEFHEGGWDDWLDIQVKAIEALADLGIEEAVPGIVEAIDDEDGQDLSELGFKALAKLGTPGIEALARYLARGGERRRRRVAAVLAASDAPAAQPAIGQALADRSKDVRLAAARVLASKCPADGRLAALFSDPDPSVRAEAVRLCGREHPERLAALLDIGTAPVTPAVLGLLAERPDLLPRETLAETIRAMLCGPEVACAAAGALALAAVEGEAACDALNTQLRDTARPVEVRLAAIKGLARIGGDAAMQALAEVVGDDTRQVRLEAMAALVAAAAAGESWPNPAGETLLAALRGELVPAPDAEVASEDTVAEAEADDEAAQEDGDAESEPAFPTSTLQAILGEEAPPVVDPERGDAPVELTQDDLDRLALAARTPRKRAVPVTPEIAPHQDVRRFAARALGDLPRPEVAHALADVLGDGDMDVRSAAADSLARIAQHMKDLPDPASDALLRALIDAERDVRLAAIRALGAAGGAGTARVLVDRLRDKDSFIRAETVRALDRLDTAGPEVEALLRDPDPGVRLAAAEAVAAAAGAHAVDLLTDFAFAFEGYHRREAGRLLRRLDADAASRRFLAALDDPDRLRFWPVAIEALEELNRGNAAPCNDSTPHAIHDEGAGV